MDLPLQPEPWSALLSPVWCIPATSTFFHFLKGLPRLGALGRALPGSLFFPLVPTTRWDPVSQILTASCRAATTTWGAAEGTTERDGFLKAYFFLVNTDWPGVGIWTSAPAWYLGWTPLCWSTKQKLRGSFTALIVQNTHEQPWRTLISNHGYDSLSVSSNGLRLHEGSAPVCHVEDTELGP